ncbi:MAG: tyrosine-type recombinase/integrase [Candidatus Heimdallarchaeaceae archaeon]
MKFEVATDKYLKYYEVTKANGTYRFNKTKANVILDFFNKRDTDEIEETEILELILFLRDKNPNIENATINKYIGVLKRIISHTTEREIKFDKLPEEKKLVQIIPPGTINRIFKYLRNGEHAESNRNLLMFKLLLDTGLRISELLSLKVSNIDFDTHTIHVTETKTKVHRYVFYTQSTQTLMNKYLLSNKIKSKIFINLETRKPITVDSVQKICQRIGQRLRIKISISPHKWRHTFATSFVDNNGNMEVLRMLLGHTTLTTTQKYLHIGSKKLRNEYNRVINRP